MSDPFDGESGSRSPPWPSSFDLDGALSAIVALHTRIPEDALTAPVLGTERAGHGVVISGQGLVLTIGYLITEADTVWLVDQAGRSAPGHVVGYDQETGFGLVQALQSMSWPWLELGSSAHLEVEEPVLLAGHGGREAVVNARVIARREFAGYWEYVLEDAIFTAPAHPNWGGAALLADDGKLCGIGSLLVQHMGRGNATRAANMIVPIDLLKPILADMQHYGRPNRPPRPWLGWLVQEVDEHLVVAGVYEGCPAQSAGLRVGDLVLEVNGAPVSALAELFRRIWSLGEAGVAVPLTIGRDDQSLVVVVASTDRNACLKTASVH